jgi:two-component system, NtrC family, nitrogen regulation sensor histidine kinase GlnL
MSSGDERLLVVLDSVPVGIVALDRRGCVELQNGEASRILGLSVVATRGRPFGELLGDGHPAVALLEQVRKSGREMALRSCMFPERIGRRALRVDLTASPILHDESDEGTVLTLRDRTIEEQLEALAAQRASDELFQHLAAGIAHEIRNPLSGIRGAAELLESKLGDASLARYPQLVKDETDRIRRLLDDFSQLTRGRELALAPVNLHRILDRILELHASTPAFAGITIEREYDPSIPEMRLDPDRTTQIFLNLVRNAVQAMKGSGRLTVRTRVEPLFHLSEANGVRQRLVRVDVEDTGPGIPESDLPHIFTPFFTTKTNGTGLGLAIVQHWVVRHGGRISASPAHAGGARMRVLLPVGTSP